jgi:hypothetical protein
MADPQPGDRFHEFHSFWVHVVARKSSLLVIHEYHPPAVIPEGAHKLELTVEQFQARYTYRDGTGYWIRYRDDRAFELEREDRLGVAAYCR